MRELNDYAGEYTGEAWQDDGTLIISEPAPEPAAPTYDVDAPDSEWHDKPVTSAQMALDVLKSGRSLITQCGPLQVTLEPTVSDGEIAHVTLAVWNTVTCADVVTAIFSNAQIERRLHVYGHVAAGDWHVYCPDEPDGAPRY